MQWSGPSSQTSAAAFAQRHGAVLCAQETSSQLLQLLQRRHGGWVHFIPRIISRKLIEIFFFFFHLIRVSPCRAGGIEAEVPPLLVRLRQEVFNMGLLPLVAEVKGVCEVHGDGSLPGSGDHHMYCAEHAVHGSGALPHD